MKTGSGHRHAEIDEVWARDEEIKLVGVLPPSVPGDLLWRLRLAPRPPAPPVSARGRALRPFQSARRTFWRGPGPFIATVAGERFEVAVPIGSLRLPLPIVHACWDLRLISEYEEERLDLPLGRYCGVPPKAESITFPWQRVEGWQRFRVRPRYRPDDTLTVESRRAR
ncbi:hypothetical protein SMC26_15100 [Actinomadura fulvescens]|uniref:Uncharacterized protein n=1 Tax=Actinomadura fulvescens TaxID=46160 RepID=A0ABP6D2R5_9ACTN